MAGERLTPAQARRKHQAEFQAFWKVYPRHTNINEAERVFSELLESDPSVSAVFLVEKARAYARSIEPENLKYVPAPHRWLQDGRYQDTDLFSDQSNAEREWLRGCWQRVDVSAVEQRFNVKMPRPELPDDIAAEDVREFYKTKAQQWIQEQAERIEGV